MLMRGTSADYIKAQYFPYFFLGIIMTPNQISISFDLRMLLVFIVSIFYAILHLMMT